MTSFPASSAGPTIVLLVAGMGSRFERGAGGDPIPPKWMVPVGPAGESILDLNATAAEAAGFRHFVLVTRSALSDQLDEARRSWPASRHVSVCYQDREPRAAALAATREKPPGTAHAVLVARELVEPAGAFGVANGDDVYGGSAFGQLAEHLAAGRHHGLVAFPIGRTLLGTRPVNRGLCRVDDDGFLRRVEEGSARRDDEGRVWWAADGTPQEVAFDAPASMNLWSFQPRIFDDLEQAVSEFVASSPAAGDEVLLPRVVDATAERERVEVIQARGSCLGLTHTDDLGELRRHLEREQEGSGG